MKTKKYLILVSVCLIFVLNIVTMLTVFAGDIKPPVTENKTWLGEDKITIDTYTFPYTPDNGIKYLEFAKMEITEKYKALQIPEKILENISTEGLIETCVSYPLFGNIFAFDSIQAGYDRLKENFDGFNALNERKDAGEKIIKMYKNMDLDLLLKDDPFPSMRFTFFTYIISQDEILNSMTEEMRTEFAKVVLEKINLISQRYQNNFSIGSSILLLDNILEKDNIAFDSYTKDNIYIEQFLEICIQSVQEELQDPAEYEQNPNNKYWIDEK